MYVPALLFPSHSERFLHAATASRAAAIDCGMLAAMEAKEGPPKGYMAEEAVQKKQARRLAECSFKTKLETGKFAPGCLSEKVKHQTKYHNVDTREAANPFTACLSNPFRHGKGGGHRRAEKKWKGGKRLPSVLSLLCGCCFRSTKRARRSW